MSTVSPYAAASAASSTAVSTSKNSLTSSDFLKLLVTELQNQDPTKPMSNQDMLTQVSQISSLQSNTDLTSTLKDLTTKNQISTGSALIGKAVAGLDSTGAAITGVVTSVNVQGSSVLLQLDGGRQELDLTQVTSVAPITTPTSPTTTG